MKTTTAVPVSLMIVTSLLMAVCASAPAGERGGGAPRAKLTIRAVDENLSPQSNMTAHVWLSEKAVLEGLTDGEGLFVAEGECTIKDVPIRITRTGYYDTSFEFKFPGFAKPSEGAWAPWNPSVTAVVRRVVSPVPMYVRGVSLAVPTENEPIGFDLIRGDWVGPYGSGQRSDLVFSLSRHIANQDEYEGVLQLSFAAPLDGIQTNQLSFPESAFRFPRSAPLAGYQTNWSCRVGRSPKEGSFGDRGPDRDRSYLIRVRSVADEKGNLREALYGLIDGPIRIKGVARRGKAEVVFTYILNPTPNDRNLEFDLKRNLFETPRSTEGATAP